MTENEPKWRRAARSDDHWPTTLKALRDHIVRAAADKHALGDSDAFAFLDRVIEILDATERQLAKATPARRRASHGIDDREAQQTREGTHAGAGRAAIRRPKSPSGQPGPANLDEEPHNADWPKRTGRNRDPFGRALP